MAVKMTVMKGTCQAGYHEVGDVIMVDGTTPGGVCLGAWTALGPYVTALMYGANFPWESEEGVATIQCSDPKGIVFELRRVDGDAGSHA